MDKVKFNATDGWFNRCKKRNNIVYKHTRGAGKSADFLAADEWIKRERPKIIAEYSPQTLTIQTKQDSIFVLCLSILICLKMKVLKGFKSSKERVTVLCCANIKSEKRDLLVIEKSKNPRCFKGV
jgi:hypothetical protein